MRSNNEIEHLILHSQDEDALAGTMMPDLESRQAEAADRLIDAILKMTLSRAPGATRIRLALVHDGVAETSPPGLPCYDVTNSAAVRGRAIGATPMNRPLAEWSTFMPALLAGEWTLQLLRRTGVAAGRARIPSPRPVSALICPVADAAGKLAGALFVLWDGEPRPPGAKAVREFAAAAMCGATQIAHVVGLCNDRPARQPLVPSTAERHRAMEQILLITPVNVMR